MHLGEGGDADTEVSGLFDEADQFGGEPYALRMLVPGAERVTGWVAAQRENVANALVGVVAEDVAQLCDAVVDRGEVGNRGECRLLGDAPRHVDGPAPRRAAGAVGDRDESGRKALQSADRGPESCFGRRAAGRHEFEGVRAASTCE
ncbi:hypothetical protein GCM10020256_16600 [Streptomyces thermocoprophilus]